MNDVIFFLHTVIDDINCLPHLVLPKCGLRSWTLSSFCDNKTRWVTHWYLGLYKAHLDQVRVGELHIDAKSRRRKSAQPAHTCARLSVVTWWTFGKCAKPWQRHVCRWTSSQNWNLAKLAFSVSNIVQIIFIVISGGGGGGMEEGFTQRDVRDIIPYDPKFA